MPSSASAVSRVGSAARAARPSCATRSTCGSLTACRDSPASVSDPLGGAGAGLGLQVAHSQRRHHDRQDDDDADDRTDPQAPASRHPAGLSDVPVGDRGEAEIGSPPPELLDLAESGAPRKLIARLTLVVPLSGLPFQSAEESKVVGRFLEGPGQRGPRAEHGRVRHRCRGVLVVTSDDHETALFEHLYDLPLLGRERGTRHRPAHPRAGLVQAGHPNEQLDRPPLAVTTDHSGRLAGLGRHRAGDASARHVTLDPQSSGTVQHGAPIGALEPEGKQREGVAGADVVQDRLHQDHPRDRGRLVGPAPRSPRRATHATSA